MKRVDGKIGPKALAGLVCSTLRARGIDSVLVGGAVVSIYSNNRYLSDDLDFVSHQELKAIAPVMRELGFQLKGRRATHPATPLYVEFCNPPVAIGGKPVRPHRIKTARGALDTLSPTHCVMDRLAAFYHWNDRQALEQALAVAARHKIDFAEIERWSADEGHRDRYREFKARLGLKKERSD